MHIGKEADKIEDEPLDGGNVQVFRNIEKERRKIVEMRQCEAEKLGIARVTRWRMKKSEKNKPNEGDASIGLTKLIAI